MRIEEYSDLLERQGADPERWTAPQRAAAEALLASSAEARGVLERAQQLDAMIADALRPEPVSPALESRLHRIPHHPPRRAEPFNLLLWMLRSAWYVAPATAVASLTAGFLLGATLPVEPAPQQTVDLMSLVYGATPNSYNFV